MEQDLFLKGKEGTIEEKKKKKLAQAERLAHSGGSIYLLKKIREGD